MLSADESKLGMYESEFLSYLITENGIQFSPQKSLIKIAVPQYGQMKFNGDGTILACADEKAIYLFDFDKSLGTVSLKQIINVSLANGYGLEFSPNDRFLYINEKQYDLNTGTLTSLMDYDCPSQWQRAKNGKLYKLHMPDSEISIFPNDNGWLATGNSNSSLRLAQINQPNVAGVGCQYDTAFIYEFHSNYSGMSMGLPHFPSYHFYHPTGEFNYTGSCTGELFQFQLVNSPISADSVHWIFDNGAETTGLTASHVFSESGTFQVSTIVYTNGIADTTNQCVSVCGNDNISLPSVIDLCETGDIEINIVNPCISNFEWSSGDTTGTINILNAGTYILKTVSACGIEYDTINAVKEDCQPVTKIPNVFTPNSDGANDLFSIDLKNVSSFDYQIFNRWGNAIKDSSIIVSQATIYNWNNFTLWDGLSQGKEASEGIYFYLIRLETNTGEQELKQGIIQLLR